MGRSASRPLADSRRAFLAWGRWINVGAVVLVLGVARLCGAACSERPTVAMDERTAASHLMAKRDVELPEGMAWFTEVQKVVLLVTVDRRGTICDLKPVAGPAELKKVAMEVVKRHWRYRPFLVDGKPVVAQFPVTVRFVPPRQEEPRWFIVRELGSSRALLLRA